MIDKTAAKTYKTPYIKNYKEVLKRKFSPTSIRWAGVSLVVLVLSVILLPKIYDAGLILVDRLMKKQPIVLSSTSFSANEIPTFDFNAEIKVATKGAQVLGVTSDEKIGDGVSIRLINLNSGDVLGAKVVKVKGDQYQLEMPEGDVGFAPGRYWFQVNVGNKEMVKEFTWGVLAINTNKGVYTPGEEAEIQIGALDYLGHTLCDSNLELIVLSPDGDQIKPEIKKSGVCNGDTFSSVPDYSTSLKVSKVGTYSMQLTNLDYGYKITDSFEVQRKVSFDIERVSLTRIYPFEKYEMKIKVTPSEDYKGSMFESLPTGFTISEYETYFKEGRDVLKWDVDLKKGETHEFKYTFDAPNLSPEIYFLGPLTIGEYTESRKWQIASDADVTLWDDYPIYGTWKAPTGVTTVAAEAWGGGGAGAGNSSSSVDGEGAGGGGAYAKDNSTSVTAGNSYTAEVAVVRTGTVSSGGTGLNSYFINTSTVNALGGVGGSNEAAGNGGGAGGSGTSSTGDVKYSGGQGGNGGTGGASNIGGGGGGGGAGDANPGGTGGNGGAGTGGTAGTGGSSGGGAGGAGSGVEADGAAGTAPGGGGSGAMVADNTDHTGGNGAAGLIRLTYTGNYPKIETISTGRDSGNATSHTITMPSGITAGDLLVIIFSTDGNPTCSIASGGWTKMEQTSNGTVVTQAIFYKVAAGGDTATVSTDSTQEASHLVYRISNAGSTVTGTAATGAYFYSDCPSHTPSGGAKNYLYVCATARDNISTPETSISGFANLRYITAATTGGASTSTMTQRINASSNDPGTFSHDMTARDNVSYTLSIEPASSPITLQGTVYTNEGTTNIGANKTVNLRVNGAGAYTDETDADGKFSIEVTTLTSGNVVTAYLDNETEEATTVMISDGSAATDINLYQNTVIVRHDTGTSIIPDNLSTGDDTDEDVKYTVSAASNGNLSVDSGFELHVWGGDTLDASGGTITTQGTSDLHIDDSSTVYLDTATNTVAGDVLVDGGATLRINASLAVNGGAITTSGTSATITRTSGTAVTTISGDGSIGGGTTPSITFYDLTTSGTGVTTIASPVTTTGDISVGSGTTLRINANLTVNGGQLATTSSGIIDTTSGTPTVTMDGSGNLGGGSGGITIYNLASNGSGSTTVASNNIIISNTLSIGANHVFAMGTNSLTVGSTSIADSGDITVATGASTTHTSGTVTILGSTSSADWAGPGTFTVSSLTIGNSSATFTVDNETSDLPLDVNGDFTVTTNATFNASSTANFYIGNAFSNSGTFEAGSGTVRMDATDASGNTLSGTMTTSSAFYDLTFNGSGGSFSFSNNATVDHNFTITAATAVTAPSSLTVTGTFTGGSAFTPNSGTVTLNGASGSTQTIAGSSTFYNLSASASAGRILSFTASTTQTITNNLTLAGTDCDNLLFIRSSAKGTAYNLDDDTGGTTSITYVDIQDANASDQAMSATSSIDSGNTTITVAASACEGGTGSGTAEAYSFQRKTFYDETNGSYWLFFHDGDEIEVKFSDDTGTTWEPPTTEASGHLAYDTNDFSVWRETISSTEYVFMAVKDGYSIKVLAGTLTASNITWDGDIDTVLTGTSATDAYSYPYIALDSSDYIWVGARHLDGTNYTYKTTDSTAIGSTDLSSVGWNTAIQMTNDQNSENVYGNIVPLSSQDMYATVAVGTGLKGCRWDNDDGTGRWENSAGTSSCSTTVGAGGESGFFDSLETGLLGYWKMNEASWNGTTGEVLDETTNNFDGTRGGDATTSAIGFNRSGTFDGTGDYVVVTEDPDMDLTSALTMSAWFKREGGTNEYIMAKTKSGSDGGYALLIGTSGEVYCRTSSAGGVDQSYTNAGEVDSGDGYHLITAVLNGSSCRVYIDGVDKTTNVDTHATPTTNDWNLYFGADPNLNGNYAYGKMDEVRLYSRALSVEEVNILYQYRPERANIYDADDFGPLPAMGRQVVRSKAGVMYTFINDGGSCEVWKSTDEVSWTELDANFNPTCISATPVALTIGSDDTLYIAYVKLNGSNHEVWWNYLSSEAFGSPYEVGPSDTYTSITELAMAIGTYSSYSNHVVFVDSASSTKVYYNRFEADFAVNSLALETVSGSDTVNSLSIAIDEDNFPEVAYINSADNDLTALVGTTVHPDIISEWSLYDVDTDVNDVSGERGVSIAVDTATGNTWIAYVREDSTTDDITLARRVDGSESTAWSTGWVTDITNSNVGYEPSIAITGSSDIYVFYENDADDISYDVFDGNAGWYHPSWSYRTKLIIEADNVDADLSNYPVYVDLNDLPANFHSHVNQTDARDIRVTKSDGVTELAREVVKYDSSTDIGELHFIYSGTLSGTTDTTVYVYYGNSGASDYATNDIYGAENVWDDNYNGVWHFQETSGTRYDSTSNGNDLSDNDTVGYSATEKICGAADFEADTVAEYLSRTDANLSTGFPGKSGSSATSFTVGYWAKAESLPYADWIGKRDDGSNGWYFFDSTTNINFRYINTGTTYDTATTISTGSWTHLVGVHDTTNNVDTIYKNSTGTSNTNRTADATIDDAIFMIGGTGSWPGEYDGLMDEVRISNIARDQNWISTEYKNQNSPGTFFNSFGTEENVSTTLWGNEVSVQSGTFQDVKAKWAFEFNNYGANTIDYIFSDGTDVFFDSLRIRRMPNYVDNASDFDDPIGAGRQVVRDSNGYLYTVVNDTGVCELWKSTNNGNTWTQQDSADSPTCDSAEAVAVAIDGNDDLYLAYPSTIYLKSKKFISSTSQFGTEENIYSGATNDTHKQVAISLDLNNVPHVVWKYYDDSATNKYIVAYSNKVTSSWFTTPISVETYTSDNFFSPDITVNASDLPEIVYTNSNADDLTAQRGIDNNATSFTEYDVDTLINDSSNQRGCSIGVDSSGNTWIAYIDSTGYVALAKNTGNWTTGWTTDTTKTDVGYEPSVAIYGTDIYAFYTDDQDNIVYDLYDGGTAWIGETMLEEHASLLDVKAKWSYVNNFDSAGNAYVQRNSAYLDGSDVAAVETPSLSWSSVTNSDDGSLTTYAETALNGSTSTNYIQIEGTNMSTAIGNSIGTVKASLCGYVYQPTSIGSEALHAVFYTNGLGESLGSILNESTIDVCSSFTALSTPSGGWTWQKLNDLEVKIYATSMDDDTAFVSKVQIKVENTASTQEEIDYIYNDGTDIFYNRIALGVSSVAGTQDSIDTLTGNINDNFSLVSNSSDTAHLIFIDDETTDQVSYKKWTSAGGWTTPALADSLVSGGTDDDDSYVSLTLDSTNSMLYALWTDTVDSDIFYSYCTISTGCDVATEWAAESGQETQWKSTGTNNYVTSNYSATGRVFAEWTKGTTPLYTIDWGSIKAPAGGPSPVVTNVSLNGGSLITLTEGTTTSISWTATITDTDGNENIASANGKAYRSGVSGAQECTNNNSNCYEDADCTLSSCTGNTCTATCSISMQFFADATDTGSTYEAQYWRGWVEAIDDDTNTGTGFSPADSPDVESTAGLSVTSSIDYGSLLPGDDTGSVPETITVTNTGNTTLDTELSGDDLCTDYPTCSGHQIGVGYQEYDLTTFTYGDGTGLTSSPVTSQTNLVKATQNPSNSSTTVYWGIGIPTPKEDGGYTGQNVVGAVDGGS